MNSIFIAWSEKMYQKKGWSVAILSLMLVGGISHPVSAETVMAKIKRTGVLTAGTSKDAIPFAYTNNKGQSVGYSVEMLVLIKEQIS
jgi:polar amino acid transport system substrate-binding protein